jgi:hypothetical protein
MHLRIGGSGRDRDADWPALALGAQRLVSASDRRPCPRFPCSGPEKKRSMATLSYPISRFFVRVWTAADSFETPRPCYRAYILLITCRKQAKSLLCSMYSRLIMGVLRLAVGCHYLFTLTSLVMSWFTILDWKSKKLFDCFVRLEMQCMTRSGKVRTNPKAWLPSG